MCISLEAGPPKNLLPTSVSFRAGSELTPMIFLSRHIGDDAFTGLHSSAHLVFTRAHHNPTVLVLTLGVSGAGATDAEPVEVEPVSDHVLLGLEKDDVHLGCKQAAQHNKATETHRDAHGGGLHLGESGHKALCFSMESLKCKILETLLHNSTVLGFALVQAGVTSVASLSSTIPVSRESSAGGALCLCM